MFSYMPEYTEPLYRPPSEARSLIFQITHGCSYNDCAFCGMYINKPFEEKPVEDVLAEIDRIPNDTAHSVKKIFLADGDAAIYPFDGMKIILERLREKFPRVQRVSAYAGPHALVKKSAEEWKALRELGLKLLYFGLESGNNEVLKLMNKGMNADKILPHFIKVRDAGIDFSVMVILGGGGKRLAREHMQDTAAWLNKANPKFVSLLTLFLRRKKDYFNNLETPTWGSLIDEARTFISNINTEKQMIFRSNHVSNLLVLEGNLPRDKERLLDEINRAKEKAKAQGVIDDIPDFYEEF